MINGGLLRVPSRRQRHFPTARELEFVCGSHKSRHLTLELLLLKAVVHPLV